MSNRADHVAHVEALKALVQIYLFLPVLHGELKTHHSPTPTRNSNSLPPPNSNPESNIAGKLARDIKLFQVVQVVFTNH